MRQGKQLELFVQIFTLHQEIRNWWHLSLPLGCRQFFFLSFIACEDLQSVLETLINPSRLFSPLLYEP